MATDGWQLLSEHHFAFARLLYRFQFQFILAGVFLSIISVLLALEVVDDPGLLLWAGLVVTVLVLPWVLICLLTWSRSVNKVTVYEQGITWVVKGRQESRSWDDIREVYRAEKNLRLGRPDPQIRLVFKKRDEVVFDPGLTQFFPLATLLEAIVTERLLPEYRQALAEGGASFGPIGLKRQGIRMHAQEFAWEEVEEVAICEGGLVVSPFQYAEYTGEFAEFGSIPNYLVLLKLLEELGRQPVSADKSIFLLGRPKS